MRYSYVFLIPFFLACQNTSTESKYDLRTKASSETNKNISEPSLVVLGTFQDAGSPHIACKKDCCAALFKNPESDRKVVSLGVVDPENNVSILFEATPDISTQVKELSRSFNSNNELPDAIFLTHAHIGHYTGLQYLGKEATNASEVKVFAMPRMKKYLETNGPWDLLVSNKNIQLEELNDGVSIKFSPNITVIPFTVPHRDEYSETVGYRIEGPSKKILFIPDIDKWEKWDTSIIAAIASVDHAFIDATFYHGEEINMRDISEIPHPFIIESVALFENLSSEEKNKIHFIHFNHTNPIISENSEARITVENAGFNIAKIRQTIKL